MMRIFKQSNSDDYKLSYSDLFLVSIDPRVKPEGDCRRKTPEGDERGRKPECDNFYKVMPRFGTNRPGIFELDDKLNNRNIPGRFLAKMRGDFNNNFKQSSLRGYNRGQAIFELVFCILVSSTSIAQAECVPLPDCASIGYTETSCEGGFVRCPFDISKLYCMPCDSSYQYDCNDEGEIGKGVSCNGKYKECGCDSLYKYYCTGANITGGSGNTCGGMYASCTCASGYEWTGTTCQASCSSDYKYTCTDSIFSGGSGTSCGEKYKSCNCIQGYWNSGSCCYEEILYSLEQIWGSDYCTLDPYYGSEYELYITIKETTYNNGEPGEERYYDRPTGSYYTLESCEANIGDVILYMGTYYETEEICY